jgi:hypothetical protein
MEWQAEEVRQALQGAAHVNGIDTAVPVGCDGCIGVALKEGTPWEYCQVNVYKGWDRLTNGRDVLRVPCDVINDRLRLNGMRRCGCALFKTTTLMQN